MNSITLVIIEISLRSKCLYKSSSKLRKKNNFKATSFKLIVSNPHQNTKIHCNPDLRMRRQPQKGAKPLGSCSCVSAEAHIHLSIIPRPSVFLVTWTLPLDGKRKHCYDMPPLEDLPDHPRELSQPTWWKGGFVHTSGIQEWPEWLSKYRRWCELVNK